MKVVKKSQISSAVLKDKSVEEFSSYEGKRIAAAMYSGLISHSDTSEDDEPSCMGKQNEDVSEDDKDIGGEVDEDPDFMASDSPPDEFQSVH